ncbi:MAG TPA: alpha/beta fold hydrolase [Mycobacteriales bacterium]|nr:alpha/beta fold hydrolase [Mycobacteriales bacterium]
MAVVERPDGARISYEADGPADAPPVLLLMGYGWPAAAWHRQVPALAERYRVLRMDNRGAGHTGVVPGAPYTVETLTGDALAVLDDAGAADVQVIGTSMGGLMAQEMALEAPERVRSLCLLASHPGGPHMVFEPEVMQLFAARLQMTEDEAAEASIPIRYAPGTSRERIDEDTEVVLPLVASREGYAAQGGTATWTRRDELKKISAPTLVLHGDADRICPLENGRILAAEIPGATLQIVPGAAHILTTDQTDLVNTSLLEWLDQHR